MGKEKSLLHNYIFNLLKTACNILFPVVTFTYAARVLGVDGVGKVNFAKSFISYFTMIASLGMNYYGTREAAKLRDSKEALSKFSMEMLLINGTSTLLAYGLFVIAMLFIPTLRGYETLLLISSAAIVLQGLGMDWLYQAVEEYRYIAVRSVLFQIGALIAMFILVRDRDDVALYALVTLLASSGSYILNFINARKYIKLHRNTRYEIARHLRPLFLLFAMAVSKELYTVLDSTMLGFIQGDTAVGLYTAAIKIEKMVNTLITAVGVVMIPRLSYYIGNNEHKKTSALIDKAYNYVFMFSIPAAVGLVMLSNEIIYLLSGGEFAAAAFTMRLLAPIVILIPFSITTNQQILVPMRKDKLILVSTVVGAGVNLMLNSVLIPHYAQNGAAVATVLSEAAVAIVCFINGNNQFHVGFVFKRYYQYWIAAMEIPIAVLLIKLINAPYFVQIALSISVSAVLYLMTLFLLKNQYAREAVLMVSKKMILGRGQKNR